MQFDPELWTRSLREIVTILAAWLPRLLGALVWLVLGWVVARLAQFILAGLLRRIGLDRLLERAGVSQLLANAGFDPSASKLIARLVYWLVLLIFVLAATESLGLSRVVDTLSGVVEYLPNVLAAVLILLFGGLLARVAGDAVGGLATQAGVATGPLLGQLVRYVLLAFVAILALEQLQVQTTLLIAAAIAIVASTALTLALAFGLGNRELARNIMSGFHAKEAFNAGQHLKIGDRMGRLVSIGTVKAVIETEAGLLSLPNSVLTDEEVTIVSDRTES
jgi:small-conductance mechanosensitive channel